MVSFLQCFSRQDQDKLVKTIVLYFFFFLRGTLAWVAQPQPIFSDVFSRLVEKYRERKGLSRAALARKSGLHQTYIGLLEREKRSPNLDTAKAIATALELPLAKMIAEAEKED